MTGAQMALLTSCHKNINPGRHWAESGSRINYFTFSPLLDREIRPRPTCNAADHFEVQIASQ
jgi:hypothetical protein